MIKTWIKPNGMEIELNDNPATEAKALELGWTLSSGDASPNLPDLDANGLPWDERIYNPSRQKDDDGLWLVIPGTDELFLEKIEAELHAKVASSVTIS